MLTELVGTFVAGELPIKPELTPGWGVAGVILILTGFAYALVGIKNRWVHTFMSTAYMAALGVTVLIVYLMNVSTSNDAIQGGYVVAVVVTGCVFGVASVFFKEITEGLGCALGGFCMSMWLLCLTPNGLLEPVASKAIFISCFTLGGLAFYFSRWTRDWALIIMISFSGATVTTLGIDCFSRAGLKEFWAWVWDLNDELFPFRDDGYPLTKGIRVETAVIIIITLLGVISQIKLWKIVREKRQKKEEEAAEGRRNLNEEEENVGRNIEQEDARERRQWERAYGNGEARSSTASRISSDAVMTSEKKLRSSHTDSSKRQSTSVEVIEMADMAESEQTNKSVQHEEPVAASLMTAEQDKDGRVTVRVAADDSTRPAPAQILTDDTSAAQDNLTTDRDSFDQKLPSTTGTKPAAPSIVPLPFIVPVEDDARSDADRSSVATFADDDANEAPPHPHRQSLVKRLSHLSHGSAELLRSLSHRSGRMLGDEHGHTRSTEDLVIPASRPHDDNGSLAATVDDESLSDGDGRSLTGNEPPRSIEITAQLSDTGYKQKPSPSQSEQARFLSVDTYSNTNQGHDELPSEEHEKTKSVASATSARASLTKDRLPRSLSRVALSYRTNEWAKHLSNADAPEPDNIQIQEPESEPVQQAEAPAPVCVEELQKAAHEGTPAPAIAHSDSYISNLSHSASRRSLKQNIPATLAILNGENQNRSPGTTPTSAGMPRLSPGGMRRTSGGIGPIAEERDATSVSLPIPEGEVLRAQSLNPAGNGNPAEIQHLSTPNRVSYASPQTLLGQREVFLRSKTQGNLLTSPSDVSLHNPYRASSDAGSLANYNMYAAAVGADVDDIPLSQRKQLMRHNSSLTPSASTPSLQYNSGVTDMANSEVAFDSRQPKRVSTLPTSAARESALATFRHAVAHDLRAGTPILNSSGRETPFTPSSRLAGRESEVQRNLDMGRNIMMGQKEADAQRREVQRQEKEFNDRVFDQRMRNGDLLDIHREAMRKMQKKAKD